MGFSHPNKVNNWNPWINSNVLVANLLTETDGTLRLRFTEKCIRSLERFCDGYDPDGGCDEGPGYWNAAAADLFDALDLLDSESGSQLKIWSHPLLRAMGRFPMLMHLGEDQFVNFADGQRRGNPDGALLARYGRLVGDRDLEQFGRWALARQGGLPVTWVWGHFQRNLANLFLEPGIPATGAPLLRDALLPDLQVLVCREASGSTWGFSLAAKGGHNAESHNHNDAGSFILYLDGKPLFVDAGVGEYTKKTFSSERYSIWTMQSAWHNLPQIGKIDQACGAQYQAKNVQLFSGETDSRIGMDLEGAWPVEAGIQKWRRTLVLSRMAGSEVTVEDRWELEKAQENRLHLLSLAEPTLAGRRQALIQFGGTQQAKENHRDSRGIPWLANFLQDLRFALRLLRKSPGFTFVAVLTLGLCIGANTAIFSVVDALLIRPLTYTDAGRLVAIHEVIPKFSSFAPMVPVSAAHFREWQKNARSFDQLILLSGRSFTLTGTGDAQRIPGARVSSNVFTVLGVKPQLGRSFPRR